MAQHIEQGLDGISWPLEKKLQVWNKAKKIYGKYKQAHLYRKDRYGNEIHWNQHNNRNHKYGWEIDHIRPKGPKHKGNEHHLNNLQPLHWRENVRKAEHYRYSDEKRLALIKKEQEKKQKKKR